MKHSQSDPKPAKGKKKGFVFGRRVFARNYPECGCASPEDCVICPTCGSCMRGMEVCPCMTVTSDDKTGHDMFQETSGG